MNVLGESRDRTKLKLFYTLLLLQNCLLLQVAGKAIPSDNNNNNDHGLIRNANAVGLFIPLNSTSLVEEKEMGLTQTMESETIDPLQKEVADLEQEAIEVIEEYEDSDETNKAKRSKGILKRLIQKLRGNMDSTTMISKEFEKQMMEEGGEGQTTEASGGILSKLNPITIIGNIKRKKVNALKSMLGFGGGKAEGATGGSDDMEGESATRDAADGGNDGSAGVKVTGTLVGGVALALIVLYTNIFMSN